MTSSATLLGSGFMLGLSVAAPLGPVGAAAIREGLERGFLGAFLLGMGAATVDFVYLGLVYVGVAPLLLRLPLLVTGFHLFGALLLIRMAIGALKQAWAGTMPTPGKERSGRNAYLYGVGITLLNPATIVSWMGLGGAFASAYLPKLTTPGAALVVLSVFAGSATWFTLLAAAVSSARRVAGKNPLVFRLVNAVAGLALAVFAFQFLTKALGWV